MTQSVNMPDNSVNSPENETFNTSSAEETGVTFSELGVPDRIVRVLDQQGKTTAFPIQQDTLPDTLAGKDVLGRGETGSGKTLAYAIPLVVRLGEQLMEAKASGRDSRDSNPVHALILAPTRELVNQINDVIQPLAASYGMKTCTIFGGVRYGKQIGELRAGAQIVLACPGRLEDLLSQKALSLDSVEITVLDEADLMADLGFLPAVNRLMQQIPAGGQHLFFSATLDHGIDTLVKRYLHNAKVHEIDAVNAQVETMTQHVFEIKTNDKSDVIEALAAGKGKRILFTRTKHQAEHLAERLTKHGIPSAQLHGNLSQNQRDRNMAVFKNGAANVLVATDVAARGVDVPAVELVVQVDPPKEAKSFLHRSGRTARAGQSGDVVTLVTPDQKRSTRRMLRQAAIKAKPMEIVSDSPELLDLVGPKADYVDPRELTKALEDFTRSLNNRRKNEDRAGRKPRHGGKSSSRNHDRSRSHESYGHDRDRRDRRDRDRDDFRSDSRRNSHNDFRKDSLNERRHEAPATRRDERGTWHEDDGSFSNRRDRRQAQFGDDRKYRGKGRDYKRNDRRDRDRDFDRSDRFEHSDRRHDDDRRSEDRRGYRGKSSARKADSNPFSDHAKSNSRRGGNRRNDYSASSSRSGGNDSFKRSGNSNGGHRRGKRY